MLPSVIRFWKHAFLSLDSLHHPPQKKKKIQAEHRGSAQQELWDRGCFLGKAKERKEKLERDAVEYVA